MANGSWSPGQRPLVHTPEPRLHRPRATALTPRPRVQGQRALVQAPRIRAGRHGSRDPSGPADVHGPSTMPTGAWVNSKGQCSDLKAPARSNKHWQAKLHRQAPPASRPPPPVAVSWTACSRSPSACPRSVHGRVCPVQQNNGYEISPPPMRPRPRPLRGRSPAPGDGRSDHPRRAPRKHLTSAKNAPRCTIEALQLRQNSSVPPVPKLSYPKHAPSEPPAIYVPTVLKPDKPRAT